jgi:CheY-like chemotaxis protein
MSGQEFARFMRSTPKLAQIPIVLLTGQENKQAIAPAEELVDAFLNKPVKIEELKSCLVELLNRG